MHVISSTSGGSAQGALVAADNNKPPSARGRSRWPEPSTDRFEASSPRPSPPAAIESRVPTPPPRVQFHHDSASEPQRGATRRRWPSPVSAEVIREAWHNARERVTAALREPPPQQASSVDGEQPFTQEDALALVDEYIEECSCHVAAARLRARAHQRSLRGLMEYATHLHATQGLAEHERQYNDRDVHSMTAALHVLLASLDVELSARQHDVPELIDDADSDVEEPWVQVITRTPPDPVVPLPSSAVD